MNELGSHEDKVEHERFVPALGLSLFNPLYDSVVRLFIRERLFKGRLVDQMKIQPGDRVLDLGCGTGTLALLIKGRHPGSEVVGLDPDAGILEIARGKAQRAGTDVSFDLGYADRLPYPERRFDRVTSSLVFHHLSRETKLAALREAHRVLRPGGELHIADVGRPHGPVMHIALAPIRLVDGAARINDNVDGRLPEFMSEAGFVGVAEAESFRTLLGPVSIYRASRKG